MQGVLHVQDTLVVQFSISTHWNAYRHATGEEMIEEILSLGVDRIELGYDLRYELIPGVQAMSADGSINVGSVHNFCPIPMGAPMGHPELFTFSDPDQRVRDQAIWHTKRTVDFAAELGAGVVVAHMGNVKMPQMTRTLIEMAYDGQTGQPKFEKTRMKLLAKREKRVRKQLGHLYQCLEQIIPHLESNQVVLAMENLPTWEAIPTEVEAMAIHDHFGSPWIRSWHDFGHGQIRENLGFISHLRWLERMLPVMAGFHVHDVAPPAQDHVMPPDGHIDFPRFAHLVGGDIERVFEPSRRVPYEAVAVGLEHVREAWAGETDAGTSAPTEEPA